MSNNRGVKITGLKELVERELDETSSSSNVLMWPFPNALRKDPIFPEINDFEGVETVFTAVGSSRGAVKRFHQNYENVESLDYLLDKPVLSSDLPTMVDEGSISEMDFEYARDVAMDLKYNGRNIDEIVEDSYSMLSEQGFLIYDLHDFGPTGLYTHEEIDSTVKKEGYTGLERLNESKIRHVELFKDALEEKFPQVEVYTFGASVRDSYLFAAK